ncbi:hypothetical protein DU80_11660 [Methanosarcina mazei]|uniref:Uncharacterized protein n=1 Tax=Methanosarcina mazei TaxID=2209 RepID=A0A0F8RVA1_METMZ|nr:hypothetical protein DU47_04215 [Methanosarcina mazei]KKH91393.1 hypothetical protein DU80_11660 [Methanosarcina mazei]
MFWDNLVKSFKIYNNPSGMLFVHFLEFKVFGVSDIWLFVGVMKKKRVERTNIKILINSCWRLDKTDQSFYPI